MSKRPCLREPFDKQNGKRVHALLKCASQHLYQIDWLLLSYLSSKTSLLLTCQILGLLCNILAADEKCPVVNRDNLTIRIQMQLSEKRKTFSIIFNAFLKCRLNFQYFETKDDPHRFWIFEITDSENVVRQISKSPSLEDPSTRNMVNVSKHCWNLHRSTFIIFIDHYQVNWVWIRVPYWHAKSWYCLVTHWLPIKSIVFLIETI